MSLSVLYSAMIPRAEVFDTYWYFAAERQRIFWRRLKGGSQPYTNDPILQRYKFCNVYRVCDRVSQALIRDVIYDGAARKADDVLFRIFLFRLLNRIETWRELEERLGGISLKTFDFDWYNRILSEMRLEGPIYGNAFILCANKAFGFDVKHQNHLALLKHVFVESDEGGRLVESSGLRVLFDRLHQLPLIGDFMAYQLAIDFNYSEVFDFSENDFTVAGPGAKRGIAKCFAGGECLDLSTVIHWMVEHQEEEFERLGLSFDDLGGRRLQAIDCQGLFCEVDKYCRVKFPELASNRVRIKAEYRPNWDRIEYVFPPKWQVHV